MKRKLIFEKQEQKRHADYFPAPDCDLKSAEVLLGKDALREDLTLPSLGELEVVRHYTKLSRLNFGVDTHFYPLGSCTMKYNPKINEAIAALEGFTQLHPYQPQSSVQGALEVMYNFERLLCAVTGMSRFTFQAAAGAHGEFTGMLVVKAYHEKNKEKRIKVIVPDSAHGTNPATAGMCGYEVVVVKSTEDGLVDIKELERLIDTDVAAMMLTNPNTLGLFEEDIVTIRDKLHKKGILLYYDGANFNPLLGITTPKLMGFDVVHLNLHKTFATPHGSGGPGAAAVGVVEELVEFLPVPLVDKKGDEFVLTTGAPSTIGKVKAFYGNFLVLLKAYAYMLRLGKDGLKRAGEVSVLNANYIRKRLEKTYKIASKKPCMHEVVLSCAKQKEKGVSALEIAKRLIDYGIHPPTMYFPLIVKEALMIEPTETESKETLDYFITIMEEINREIDKSPDDVKNAPLKTKIARVDETKAARTPDLRWHSESA